MLKQSIITIPLFLTLACGSDTIVVIPQHSADLPVTELEYIEAPSIDEEQLSYVERIVFDDEASEEQPAQEEPPVEEEQPEEEPVQEEQPTEEEPVQEEEPEEEPVQEEEPAEEEPVEEEPVEEEPVEEEPSEEEQPVEEQPVEENNFSGECNLEGNIYNFQSSCLHPFACLSRHQDNFQVVPETGFCGKICFGDINCPNDTQCILNGVTPGVGYCERE